MWKEPAVLDTRGWCRRRRRRRQVDAAAAVIDCHRA